jgi:hypothetical protein
VGCLEGLADIFLWNTVVRSDTKPELQSPELERVREGFFVIRF